MFIPRKGLLVKKIVKTVTALLASKAGFVLKRSS
jgi:hypothetical protein